MIVVVSAVWSVQGKEKWLQQWLYSSTPYWLWWRRSNATFTWIADWFVRLICMIHVPSFMCGYVWIKAWVNVKILCGVTFSWHIPLAIYCQLAKFGLGDKNSMYKGHFPQLSVQGQSEVIRCIFGNLVCLKRLVIERNGWKFGPLGASMKCM